MPKFVFCQKVFPTYPSSSSPLLETITARASGFFQKAFFNTVAARGADYVVRCPPPSRGLDDCSMLPVIPRLDKPMLVGYIDKYYDVNTDHGLETSFVSKNSMPGVKEKELFHRLHKVGTLCKIKHFWADSICLAGLRRVRLTEMVNYDVVGGLLTVKVDHLKDLPFNKDDAEIKFSESVIKKYVERYLPPEGEQITNVTECDCQQLSDYAARFGIPTMSKFELHDFLEELDVHKHLELIKSMMAMLVEDRDLY